MSEARATWLERLGLGRPELRAWALYDWANSAFLTTIVAAVFPIYYNNVAARGLAPETAAFNFSIGTTIALAGGLLLLLNLAWILKRRCSACRTRAWRRAWRFSASACGGSCSRSR